MEFSETNAYKILETNTERERIQQIFNLASTFYPEPIQDLFVSEHRDQEGRQMIESVWFFTESLVGEFKNPLQEENFDAITLRLDYLSVVKENFDFDKAVKGDTPADSARMTVHLLFSASAQMSGILRASGTNCLELHKIVRDRLLPSLIQRRGKQ